MNLRNAQQPLRRIRTTPTSNSPAKRLDTQKLKSPMGGLKIEAAKDTFNQLWETQSKGKHTAMRVYASGDDAYATTGRHDFSRARDLAAKKLGRDRYLEIVSGIAQCLPKTPENVALLAAASDLIHQLRIVDEVRKDNPLLLAALLKFHQTLNTQGQASHGVPAVRSHTSPASFTGQHGPSILTNTPVERASDTPDESSTEHSVESTESDKTAASAAEPMAEPVLPPAVHEEQPPVSPAAISAQDEPPAPPVVQEEPTPQVRPLVRHHHPDSGRIALSRTENHHDFYTAAYFWADVLSQLAHKYPEYPLRCNGLEISAGPNRLSDEMRAEHQREFARRLGATGKVHSGHPDPEIRNAGLVMLAIAKEALAKDNEAPVIENSERLRNAFDVIALKVQNDERDPAIVDYYKDLIAQREERQRLQREAQNRRRDPASVVFDN